MDQLEEYSTDSLVEELNKRLVKNKELELDLKYIGWSQEVDQMISGDLSPESIDAAIGKLTSRGREPELIVIPQNKQMRLRRSEFFTTCTRKYVSNGVIGNYMDITVIVQNNQSDHAFVICDSIDKLPESKDVCRIKLVR